MSKLIVGGAIVLAAFAIQCQPQLPIDKNQTSAVSNGDGLIAMESLCISCHNSTATKENRLAPPMAAVKIHYLEKHPQKQDFINAVISFVNAPEKNKALMKGAVKKFGIMPKLNYEHKKLEEIAEYLYHHDPPKPDWFDEHHNNETKTSQNSLNLDSGNVTTEDPYLKMAMQAKKALGSKLIQAIQNKGTANAIDFCSMRAIAITDSVSKAQGAIIRRVSDKARNPINQANTSEKMVLAEFKRQLKSNGSTKSIHVEMDGRKYFYYSIETNKMCLQCHGQKDHDISAKTIEAIQAKYPNDKAIGYSENMVRGMFVVEVSPTP